MMMGQIIVIVMKTGIPTVPSPTNPIPDARVKGAARTAAGSGPQQCSRAGYSSRHIQTLGICLAKPAFR